MGILPEMSFVFSNLEKILLMKESLDAINIIPRESRWFGRGIGSDVECETELTSVAEKIAASHVSRSVELIQP
jgi:hypothetical protein